MHRCLGALGGSLRYTCPVSSYGFPREAVPKSIYNYMCRKLVTAYTFRCDLGIIGSQGIFILIADLNIGYF